MSKAAPEDIERIRESLGLNDPLPVQYVRWLEQAVQGNLGYSITSHRPVTELIWEKLPASLMLMGISLVLSMTLGILIGVIAAVKRYSLFDYGTTIFAFLGASLPSFWLSMILIWFFAVRLGWLPTGQMHSFRPQGPVWLDTAKHFVLPVIVTSYIGLIVWVRYQRGSMIEALNQDYVRTARAKGLGSKAVLYRHAWRNSLVPIVTLFRILDCQSGRRFLCHRVRLLLAGNGELRVRRHSQARLPGHHGRHAGFLDLHHRWQSDC